MQSFIKNSKRRRRVLIVDDEIINRELLETILSLNYDVESAPDGQVALDMLQRNQAEGTPYSLILLDLLMPNMSGFRLLETCRADEKLREIPVIVMTSEKSAEVRSIRMGAEDFISKPYRMPEVILARCERIIELSEEKRLIRSIEKAPDTGLYIKVFFDAYIRRALPDLKKAADAVVLRVSMQSEGPLEKAVLKAAADRIMECFPPDSGIACDMGSGTFGVFCKHREDYEAILKSMQERLSDFGACVTIGVCGNVDRSLEQEQWFACAQSACEGAPTGTAAYYQG